ncbi:MAG: hypothetical protein HYU66_17340, partial [Armatimonadetes bacterium]|nr:hypothetical protein [Armatimonadota bacterium]
IKVGRFGLDPAGGEVDCEVILPLEDAPLTFRQLQRCVAALVLLVQQQRPRFEAILATGEDPARDEGAQLDQFVDQLAALFGVSREEILDQLADAQPPPGATDG